MTAAPGLQHQAGITHRRIASPNQATRRCSRHTGRGLSRRSPVSASSTDELNTCWGHVYLNNRHHDPTLGAFISVDPLVTTTGLPYSYTAGDPINYSDPTGLCTDFVMGEDGNWTCTFYTADDGSRSVDNRGGDFCNQGANICSVDEGELPHDYVFGDQKPEEYRGVPTSLLEFEPPTDPFEAMAKEVWKHRRTIINFAGGCASGGTYGAGWGSLVPGVGTVAGGVGGCLAGGGAGVAAGHGSGGSGRGFWPSWGG